MSTHLRPTARISADVLLPGDPGRALALAQALLEQPRMANHSRGLWGYSGRTADGHELTIQATGLGGPSVAIVLTELARNGATRAIRLGTCEALDGALSPGDAVLAAAALPEEGASRALGAAAPLPADPDLHAALVRTAGATTPAATVASSDLFYDSDASRRRRAWLGRGALAAEMGTATLYALGPRLGVAVACALVVRAAPEAEPLGDDAVERESLRLGALAAAALAG